jgi:DivIVA domain-containing protein
VAGSPRHAAHATIDPKGQLLLFVVVALTVAAIVFGVTVMVGGGDPGLTPVEPDGRALPLPGDRPLGEEDVVRTRFDTAVRGYRMAQVDQALQRAAYDIGYKGELIGVLEAEVAALRDGRTADADVLRRAREAAVQPTLVPADVVSGGPNGAGPSGAAADGVPDGVSAGSPTSPASPAAVAVKADAVAKPDVAVQADGEAALSATPTPIPDDVPAAAGAEPTGPVAAVAEIPPAAAVPGPGNAGAAKKTTAAPKAASKEATEKSAAGDDGVAADQR